MLFPLMSPLDHNEQFLFNNYIEGYDLASAHKIESEIMNVIGGRYSGSYWREIEEHGVKVEGDQNVLSCMKLNKFMNKL